ncbi:MAG: glycerol-3-phosphate 1-O-acyltransferase PlsY [Thermodesulfovibrio sp.]|uniref:glycerol-3-phosphate 1-O-acyltransferase PlsY n=1 Tax=unclassified Thermodesulfovibrio TaxID=2645936 RepID=UPI00083AF945|nr:MULTISPECIES: glycerol-3-phosphate 1-O-acyltransferase PlsY [unclassified Thermodesulfovibrio]MDI1471999.1 glycerol-3-phosphate 1-O-acyltransferase PlsY [Thermodesulfovibrio sp. 1176]MDI6715208.1 glycerol-3-phosphate 1-O-acyltransferase PlsY [Thermodesulfovibrio sp.]ODA45244.1 Acyl-phosphate:glycerol-3-phosphate O-acyltransferase PlsY [Thermodesulfovibrio sp. N1]
MSFLFCLFAFFFGSIPWGYLIGKAKGIDLKKVGSGNIGATNVMRIIGRKEALITLILDILKGFVPVLIVKISPYSENLILIGVVGLLAILGHCFTPFLKFKGGKGVATSLGVLLASMPLVGFITVLIWIVTVKISKISSLGALLSFALLPLNVIILGYPKEFLIFTWLFTIIIYLRHISNIKRLIKGTEPKIGETK